MKILFSMWPMFLLSISSQSLRAFVNDDIARCLVSMRGEDIVANNVSFIGYKGISSNPNEGPPKISFINGTYTLSETGCKFSSSPNVRSRILDTFEGTASYVIGNSGNADLLGVVETSSNRHLKGDRDFTLRVSRLLKGIEACQPAMVLPEERAKLLALKGQIVDAAKRMNWLPPPSNKPDVEDSRGGTVIK